MDKRQMERDSGSTIDESGQAGPLVSDQHYRRVLCFSVFSISLVAILPLLVMAIVNHHQYQDAFRAESLRPIEGLTTNTKLSLEAFIAERVSALSLVIRTESLEDLQEPEKLNTLLTRMKRAFNGFIDLGLIDATGRQVSYAGPYELQGKNYSEQDWFHEVDLHGVHVSDAFLGYRHLPHFVIAVSFDADTGAKSVLRATLDTERIVRQIETMAKHPSSDAFLINQEGILQTPSRLYGKALESCPLPVPPLSTRAEVLETQDGNGVPLIIGYAFIEHSPFVLMLLRRPESLYAGWLSLRRDLVLFLTLSIVLILAVVFGGSKYMVNRTRQADLRRAALHHKMEYTNKMAAIGRLAAGVAHEINNPLAVIDQKAGLHRDLLSLSDELPSKERMLALVDAVLESVERCGTITHRLLGFAKHMDIQKEVIDLEILLRGVLDFLDKEASYRNLQVEFDIEEGVQTIESDMGQLQQVFLNIVNNAFAAVNDGGLIRIAIASFGTSNVSIRICDNGVGIDKDDLKFIFEPFFTTKKGDGTGLGLSITYGIVQKLGGKTKVSSTPGEGTCFSVILPVRWKSS
jgi:two-component system, NtrC family, sensor kinase